MTTVIVFPRRLKNIPGIRLLATVNTRTKVANNLLHCIIKSTHWITCLEKRDSILVVAIKHTMNQLTLNIGSLVSGRGLLKQKRLSIVIPVYNEAATVHLILDMIQEVVLINGIEKELVIVNDCS